MKSGFGPRPPPPLWIKSIKMFFFFFLNFPNTVQYTTVQFNKVQEDADWLFPRLGLEHLRSSWDQVSGLNARVHGGPGGSGGPGSDSLVTQYYRQLDRETIVRMYYKYRSRLHHVRLRVPSTEVPGYGHLTRGERMFLLWPRDGSIFIQNKYLSLFVCCLLLFSHVSLRSVALQMDFSIFYTISNLLVVSFSN